MKNNYSSKSKRAIDSSYFKDQLTRNFRNCVGTLLLTATPAAALFAQTHPVVQQVPYTQNFDSFVGSSNPVLPAGWGGWRLEGQLGTSFSGLPTADATFGKGTNNTTSPGIFDMTGKLGFLSTNNQRVSPVLAIATVDRKYVTIKYKLNVQRVNSNRGMAVKLQYRTDRTSDFTDVESSYFEYYGAGTGTNTGNGVAALETHNFEFELPEGTWLKPEVQLRWVVARTVNNQGSGDNHSFSIDDIEINGTTPPDIPVAFPYSDNFNNEKWVINSGTAQTNRFKIGTPATLSGLTFANSKLYITSEYDSETSTPIYTGSASYSYAYKDFILPADITTAKVAFRWLAKGESSFDYGRFYIAPITATTTNGTSISSGSTTAVPNVIYNARLDRTANYYALNEPTFSGTGAFEDLAYTYKDNAVDLSAYAGQTVRAVFYWRNDGSVNNTPSLIVDDFVFDYTPQCLNPTFGTTTNIEGRSAQLNWVSTASNFEYYVSTTPTAPTETTTPTGTSTTTSAVVTGLRPVTQYYAWVRTVCADNEKSEWSISTTFTTNVSCLPPTTLTNTTVNDTSAAVTWQSTAQNFKYYVSTSSTTPANTVEGTLVSGNSATITQLNPGTTYYWFVKAVCDTDDESAWAAGSAFTTRQATPATFPFIDNFDGENTWNFITGGTATAPSVFKVGTPTNLTLGTGTSAATLAFTDGKLYIAESATSTSPKYVINNMSYAYRDITLPADLTNAKVSFKWILKGEGTGYNYDYGRFLIVPLNTSLSLTNIGNSLDVLNNIYTYKNNTFQTNTAYQTLMNRPSATNADFNGNFNDKASSFVDENVNLAAYAGQTVRLIFYFNSDSSTVNNPSLIIDDFKFEYPPACVAPTDVTSSNVAARTATVTWTASNSNPTGYEYYVATTTTAPTATTQATGYTTEATANLTGLTPDTNHYVWVRSVCGEANKSEWTRTSITFKTTIACPPATAATNTAITFNSATIGWTSTATNFEYVISTTNTAPAADVEAIPVTGNSVSITDLTPNTTYYWWVRANCGEEDGKSTWLASNFTTPQMPATFPYVDNFDTNQWVFANGTQTNKFYVGTPAAADNITYADNKLFVSSDGLKNKYSTTSSSVYAYRDIVLPEDITNATISFNWIYKGEGSTGTSTPYDYGRFYIVPATTALPTAGTNLGYTEAITNAIYALKNNPVTVATNRRHYLLYNPSNTYSGAYESIAHTYLDQNVDLAAYAGQTVRVIFFFRNDSGVFDPSLAIDNFRFEYAPECLSPTGVTASVVTPRTAIINWTAPTSAPANGYEYYITSDDVVPTETSTPVVATTETTAQLTALQPATTYKVWVRSVCGETDKSEWSASPATFTTEISCVAPTALTTTNTTVSTATIGWTSSASEFEYVISTENTAPTATTEGITTATNTVDLTNLTDNTTYYWWVRNNCGTEDGKSTWTGSSFRTALVPKSFPFEDDFSTTNWALEATGQTNKFYTGTPSNSTLTFDNAALFISDNGTANQYTVTASSNAYAYVDVTLPATVPTASEISFDWYAKGENISTSIYDYGRFFIVPTSYNPNANTSISSAANITGAIYNAPFFQNSTGTGTTFNTAKSRFEVTNLDLAAYAGQTVRLLVYWRNDSSSGEQPPLAIDNLYFGPTERTTEPEPIPCTQPTALVNRTVTSANAIISWTGDSESYKYYVSTSRTAPTAATEGTLVRNNQINVTNLQPGKLYYWWVKGVCDVNSESEWSNSHSFLTRASNTNSTLAYNFNSTARTAENDGWIILSNGTDEEDLSKFTIDTPATLTIDNGTAGGNLTFADGKLFITSTSDALAPKYKSNAISYAVQEVTLPADIDLAKIKFKWLMKGEADADYGRFFIAPVTAPFNLDTALGNDVTALDNIYTFTNNSSTLINDPASANASFIGAYETIAHNFESAEINLSQYANETVRLVFYFNSNATNNFDPSLIIDDLEIELVPGLATGDVNTNKFVYYPNPVHNELNFKGNDTISAIEVYNLAGQVVDQVKVGEKAYQLNTAKLATGVYVIKVAFENGTTKTIKIIKK